MTDEPEAKSGRTRDPGRDPRGDADDLDRRLSRVRDGEGVDSDLPHELAFFEQCIRGAAQELVCEDLDPDPRVEPCLTPGTTVGGFRITGVLGSGGMSVVYEAIQESLGRTVALKLLPRTAILSPLRQERFRREAVAVSRLHHDAIVQVYDAGQVEWAAYICMELVEGCSLAELLQGEREAVEGSAAAGSGPTDRQRRGLPTGLPRFGTHEFCLWVASRAAEIADALQVAHRAGVIHRDIKPSNILVSGRNRWKLTDFGVARLEFEERLTESAIHPGTLVYSSPEQIDRTEEEIDARIDVYSLGATLYECLTLRSPVTARATGAILEEIRHGVRPPVRVLNRRVRADLATIVEKALEPARERRYATAGDMAEDLRRFLRGEVILARPPGVVERVRKWVRRRPAAAIAALASIVMLPVLAGLVHYRIRYGLVEVRQQREVFDYYDSLDRFEHPDDYLRGMAEVYRRDPSTEPGCDAATRLAELVLERGHSAEIILAEFVDKAFSGGSLSDDERYTAAKIAFYRREFATASRLAADLQPSRHPLLADLARRLSRRPTRIDLPAEDLAMLGKSETAGLCAASDDVVLFRGTRAAGSTYLALISGVHLLVVRLSGGERQPRLVPLSKVLPPEVGGLVGRTGWNPVALVDLSNWSRERPLIGVQLLLDSEKKTPHDTGIFFLGIDEDTLAAEYVGSKLVVQGEIDRSAIAACDLGSDEIDELLVGTKYPVRGCKVYSMDAFPARDPEEIESLPYLRNKDGSVSDVYAIAIDRPGPEECARVFLGLQRPGSPGIQVFESVKLERHDGRREISFAPWVAGLSMEENARLGFRAMGWIDKLGFADLDGDGSRELVVAKRATEMDWTLGAGYLRGVPDGLYCFHWTTTGPVAAFSGKSRSLYPWSEETVCMTKVTDLGFADLDGNGGDEVLAVAQIELGSQPRSAPQSETHHVLYIDSYDKLRRGLADRLYLDLSVDPGDALGSSLVVPLAEDLDGDRACELILVGRAEIAIYGLEE